eukprot:g4643.t1
MGRFGDLAMLAGAAVGAAYDMAMISGKESDAIAAAAALLEKGDEKKRKQLLREQEVERQRQRRRQKANREKRDRLLAEQRKQREAERKKFHLQLEEKQKEEAEKVKLQRDLEAKEAKEAERKKLLRKEKRMKELQLRREELLREQRKQREDEKREIKEKYEREAKERKQREELLREQRKQREDEKRELKEKYEREAKERKQRLQRVRKEGGKLKEQRSKKKWLHNMGHRETQKKEKDGKVQEEKNPILNSSWEIGTETCTPLHIMQDKKKRLDALQTVHNLLQDDRKPLIRDCATPPHHRREKALDEPLSEKDSKTTSLPPAPGAIKRSDNNTTSSPIEIIDKKTVHIEKEIEFECVRKNNKKKNAADKKKVGDKFSHTILSREEWKTRLGVSDTAQIQRYTKQNLNDFKNSILSTENEKEKKKEVMREQPHPPGNEMEGKLIRPIPPHNESKIKREMLIVQNRSYKKSLLKEPVLQKIETRISDKSKPKLNGTKTFVKDEKQPKHFDNDESSKLKVRADGFRLLQPIVNTGRRSFSAGMVVGELDIHSSSESKAAAAELMKTFVSLKHSGELLDEGIIRPKIVAKRVPIGENDRLLTSILDTAGVTRQTKKKRKTKFDGGSFATNFAVYEARIKAAAKKKRMRRRKRARRRRRIEKLKHRLRAPKEVAGRREVSYNDHRHLKKYLTVTVTVPPPDDCTSDDNENDNEDTMSIDDQMSVVSDSGSHNQRSFAEEEADANRPSSEDEFDFRRKRAERAKIPPNTIDMKSTCPYTGKEMLLTFDRPKLRLLLRVKRTLPDCDQRLANMLLDQCEIVPDGNVGSDKDAQLILRLKPWEWGKLMPFGPILMHVTVKAIPEGYLVYATHPTGFELKSSLTEKEVVKALSSAGTPPSMIDTKEKRAKLLLSCVRLTRVPSERMPYRFRVTTSPRIANSLIVTLPYIRIDGVKMHARIYAAFNYDRTRGEAVRRFCGVQIWVFEGDGAGAEPLVVPLDELPLQWNELQAQIEKKHPIFTNIKSTALTPRRRNHQKEQLRSCMTLLLRRVKFKGSGMEKMRLVAMPKEELALKQKVTDMNGTNSNRLRNAVAASRESSNENDGKLVFWVTQKREHGLLTFYQSLVNRLEKSRRGVWRRSKELTIDVQLVLGGWGGKGIPMYGDQWDDGNTASGVVSVGSAIFKDKNAWPLACFYGPDEPWRDMNAEDLNVFCDATEGEFGTSLPALGRLPSSRRGDRKLPRNDSREGIISPVMLLNFHPWNRLRFLCDKALMAKTLSTYARESGIQLNTLIPETFIFDRKETSGGMRQLNRSVDSFFRYYTRIEKYNREQRKSALPKNLNVSRNVWICKPADGACGKEIVVTDSVHRVIAIAEALRPFDPAWVVQKYMENPLTVRGGRKFDIRVWVLITSDFRICIYREGVLRTSAVPFSLHNLHDRYAHLSNHCIAKEHPEYGKFEPTNEMWFTDFDDFLREEYGNGVGFWTTIYPQIRTLVLHTARAVRPIMRANDDAFFRPFQLLGYDFMVSAAPDFKVSLIEINSSPAVADDLRDAMCEDVLRLTVDKTFPLSKGRNNRKIESKDSADLDEVYQEPRPTGPIPNLPANRRGFEVIYL